MGDHHQHGPDATEMDRTILSKEVEQLRQQLGLRQSDVSQECGVNASMLSQWMQGRYKGNVSRINRMMLAWLEQRRSGKLIAPLLSKDINLRRAGMNAAAPSAAQSAEASKRAMKMLKTLYNYPKPAESRCCLIPIHLDIDADGIRVIDSFLWNSYESEFTYEAFAAALVQDLELPSSFLQRISNEIRTQVRDTGGAFPWTNAVRGESLHPIRLHIRLKDIVLRDQFEWDLSDPNNSPETFARILCEDLGLDGEFESSIAIEIRRQLALYSTLIHNGYGSRVSRISPVSVALRPRQDVDEWEPKLLHLGSSEIGFMEREDMRMMRSTSQKSYTPSKSPVASSPKDNSDRPPKHVNTFLMFCRKWRKNVMEKHPTLNAKECSRILGEMWQKLTPEDRAKYQPLTDAENAKRLREWQQTRKPLISPNPSTPQPNPK